MFKLLSELNIGRKDYKNLALLPGFNISEPNSINENVSLLNKKFDRTDILDENILIKLITLVDEGKNSSSKKLRKGYFKKLKGTRKKK